MSSTFKTAVCVAVCSSLLTVVACGSTDDDKGSGAASSGSPASSGDFNSSGSLGQSSSGTSGALGGKECAAQEAAASLSKRPVDIVFAIDNSGSMREEIAEVEKQINDNFATIIEASKIDYRVIMVTSHGDNGDQKVCVKAPLSGAASCSPPAAQPAETAKFFHHSVTVDSTDAWCRLDEFYAKTDEFAKHPTGWGSLLRKEAFKVFVVISDDRVSCSFGGKSYNDRKSAGTTAADGTAAAADFDARLLSLSPEQFGTAANRNYVWHSIVALKEFDTKDRTKAHPASAPIVTGVCTPGAQQPATGHQAMSVLTGGLRYPTCGLDYTTIFAEMAKGVIGGAKLACDFPVPPAPAGQKLDLATVVPHYTPGDGGPARDFNQVASATACAAEKFYIEANTIKLCPATCDAVQKDPKAAIKVLFGCAVKGAN
jgi:hypothetical protein